MDNQQAESFGFNPNAPGQMQPGQYGQPEKDQGKKGAQQIPMGPSVSELMDHVNSLSRRLRMLEERYSTLVSKNQLTDQNMLTNNKKFNTEIKTINLEISELKSDLTRLKETNTLIIQDLRECAKKEDIEIVEKYLKLWEPIRFVTQTQVENIVRDLIENMGIKTQEDGTSNPKK
jgi:DNA repair exonuclease SbcCD ATPase subunit